MLYGRGALKPQKSTNALTSPEKVTRAKSDLTSDFPLHFHQSTEEGAGPPTG